MFFNININRNFTMQIKFLKNFKMYYTMYVRNIVHKHIKMNTITASKARLNLFQLFKQTLKNHLPIRINSKEGTLILMPEDDYENLLETAELLSIHGFKESIKKSDKEIEKGEVYAFDNIFGK